MRNFRGMKTSSSSFVSAVAVLLLAGNAAHPGTMLLGEELAVIQAMAAIMNRDNARPFDFLYFESEFPAKAYVDSSMSNPDRTEFCGLSRERAQAVVAELSHVTSQRVEFDKSVARPAGMAIGHKRLERFRYLTLSRVVFTPDQQHAWLAADLNGETGALFRLDRVDGQWARTARCGGWMKTAS
jgi:hypothetical protein